MRTDGTFYLPDPTPASQKYAEINGEWKPITPELVAQVRSEQEHARQKTERERGLLCIPIRGAIRNFCGNGRGQFLVLVVVVQSRIKPSSKKTRQTFHRPGIFFNGDCGSITG